MQEAILMYCPRCGKENPEKQRFCNSCGLKLESISNVITDEAAESRDDRFIEAFRGSYKGWQAPLIYAFLVIAAGMLIGFIGYKILSVKTLGDIGTLVSLVGVVVLLLKGISLLIPSDTASASKQAVLDEGHNPNRPAEFQTAETPALLPGKPASITEQTTRHLDLTTENGTERPRITQPTLD